MFELGVPFFLPMWRRVATVGAAIGWGLFELSQGAVIWAAVFIAMGLFAAYKFYVTDWAAVETEAKNDEL